MDAPHDDPLTRAQAELGEPDALFRVGPGRLAAKFAVGAALVVYGVVANYLWWVHGRATFGHLEMLLLFAPPLFGAALLWHMYRNRGLAVLVYPAGLLRLRGGEVDSFPWAQVDHVRLKVNRAGPAAVERDAAGHPTGCRLDADVPVVKVWEAGLTVVRDDGVAAELGPALADFPRLAAEVLGRTFAVLWPLAWARVRAGQPVAFDDLELGPDGLRHDTRFLPWREVKEVAVAQGKLTVRQEGRWLPWLLKDVNGVPNPHVLLALAEEARRQAAGTGGGPAAVPARQEA